MVQTPVTTNLPISVNLRQQLNITTERYKHQTIFSCIKIGNTLVFADWDHKRLIICNVDGTDIYHISLHKKPDYVTEVDINTVAVSCTHYRCILIINISFDSVNSTINTSGPCFGITYHNNNLYVNIGGSIIHVMDLTGNVIRTIPLPSDNILDITVDRDMLVCINYASIYCCSLDGKQMWKFETDEYQNLIGVTTDNEGNVYVNNVKTHTVVVVYDDGKHYRLILSESDGLDWPNGIYFDKQDNILLVCNINDGEVLLFDVKMNLT